jgi:cytochrome c551/c552
MRSFRAPVTRSGLGPVASPCSCLLRSPSRPCLFPVASFTTREPAGPSRGIGFRRGAPGTTRRVHDHRRDLRLAALRRSPPPGRLRRLGNRPLGRRHPHGHPDRRRDVRADEYRSDDDPEEDDAVAVGGRDCREGKAVFVANACGSCHTFKPAGSTATIGPDLDTKPAVDAKKNHMPLAAFVRESIVKPNAYISPGYPKGVMPQTFGKKLSKTQLDDLVAFITAAK